MLRSGETKIAKGKFYAAKIPVSIGMLILII